MAEIILILFLMFWVVGIVTVPWTDYSTSTKIRNWKNKYIIQSVKRVKEYFDKFEEG